MELNYEAIKAAAENHKTDMVAFLRRMISHPSESCEEKEVVECIREEMEKLSQDPEISIFILETLTGLSGLSQAMMEAPETEEMPWEAGGEPVPDSTEEEAAP